MVFFKNGSFSNSFFANIGQGNVFYHILDRKNAFLGYKKKSKTCHFSKGVNPWFWSKNGHFCNFCFLFNIGQENVSYNILERKNAILGYKNKKFKKSKINIFLNGLTHGFGPKMASFPTFFLSNTGQENMSYNILERKTPFSAIKTRNSKSRKL